MVCGGGFVTDLLLNKKCLLFKAESRTRHATEQKRPCYFAFLRLHALQTAQKVVSKI